MDIKFVLNYPAIVVRRTLVIADLHVGIEREFWRAGVRVSGVSRKMETPLKELLEKVAPKKIIVLGDFKHNIPDFTRKEAEDVRALGELLASQGELIVVKGNHDGDIEGMLPFADILPASGFIERDVYFLHGHAWPKDEFLDAKLAIFAHIHPAYPIEHPFGRELRKVFVRGILDLSPLGEEKEMPFILLPAFSPLFEGTDITNPDNWIGVFGRNKMIKHFEAFLLDGTPVGP